MELSFQVNLAQGKLSDIKSTTTTHAEALARYSAEVERENSLKEGVLKDAIKEAVPHKPCLYSRESNDCIILTCFLADECMS
jgi:hypothetical protein